MLKYIRINSVGQKKVNYRGDRKLSRRNNKLIKYIVTFGIISAVTSVGSIVPISANENVEAEFSAVMDKYKGEEVVVDEGV